MRLDLIEERRGPLWIWEPPEKGVHYCGGVDASMGVRGGDPAAIVMIRSDNLDQVAMWHGYTDPRQLGRVACWLGWHYNTAFMVPESNKDGQSVVFEMKDLGYENMYRTTTFDKVPGGGNVVSRNLGFNTNVKTRAWLWNHMRLVINHGWGRINSKAQLNEMKNVRYDTKGTPFHPLNGHDDLTIAWGLALVGRDQAFSTGVIDDEPEARKTDLESLHWASFDEESESHTERV